MNKQTSKDTTPKHTPHHWHDSLFDKESMGFLEKLINTPSPTGFEYTGQQVWLDYISKYTDKQMVDNYGTAVAVINPDHPYKVVIEAHCDEISRFVKYIDDKGYIYVARNGGSDHMIAPSKKVIIHTEKGEMPAVFGRPAIHTRKKSEDPAPKVETIFLDCGARDKEQVHAMGIQVGDVITYEDTFFTLADRYVGGRALDNRAGGFMIAQVAKLLHEKNISLPFGLYIVNSVQEEIGLRGAQMIAERIQPDVAIITDVCHDTTTPHIDLKKEGETVGEQGPVLTIGPAVHNKLLQHLKDTAKKHDIDFQRIAASYYTGTDTDAFAYSNQGVPSALISLPLKYMHTTVEMAAMYDIAATVELILRSIEAMDPQKPFHYLPAYNKDIFASS